MNYENNHLSVKKGKLIIKQRWDTVQIQAAIELAKRIKAENKQ